MFCSRLELALDLKWLRYRLFRVLVGGVGSDALLSSSPSLIWLSWGFGLAWAVTIGNLNFVILLFTCKEDTESMEK